MSNNICPACQGEYKIIYYQRRAADEPPDMVKYCPNCPLDTSRLSIATSIQSKHIRHDSRILSITSIDSLTSDSGNFNNGLRMIRKASFRPQCLSLESRRYMITVEGNAAMSCYSRLQKKCEKFDPITAITIPLDQGSKKELVHLYTNSVLCNNAYVLSESMQIAPFVTLNKTDVYSKKGNIPSCYEETIVSYGCRLDDIEYTEHVFFRSMAKSRQCKIVLLLSREIIDTHKSENKILSILQEILTRYGTEKNIKSFTNSSVVNSLYIQSGKAYDWPSAPDQGFTYTWKPDGERFWYAKYGSVWFFCRRLLSGRIVGWNVCKSLSPAKRTGPILDVEVMIAFNPIFIDVLVLETGEPTRAVRSLNEVLGIFNSMTSVDIPIYVRDYFLSEKELLSTRNLLKYPIDGIIGIQDGTMNIIKLKDEKSIELKLDKTGNLLSSENRIVALSRLTEIYPEESIVEIRFTKDSKQDRSTINEVILRTDKVTANAYDVCTSIMNTMSNVPDSLARREAVLWCNSIRKRMNQIAAKTTGKGRVILDIGAGDGQAVSDYSTDPEITYILIEPDKVKCDKLAKRLSEPNRGQFRLYQGAEHIIRAAGSVSTRSLKYAIICAKLEDILDQPHCIKTLKSCVRYCISSFSISYVSKELKMLALNGLNVVGCGYFYDGIDIGKCLIDKHGVTMRRIGSAQATVTWGSDRIYHETAITSMDFNNIFNIRHATSLVSIAEDNRESLLAIISSKVFIISTKKYL